MPLYKDLDMKMRGHPVKKDLLFVVDSQAVANSIKMIVMTNFYERPFNNEFGGNVRALLFDLADSETAASAEERIKNVLDTWEPRCSVVSVVADSDDHTLRITIQFRLQNKSEVNSTTISLRLTR